MRRLVSLLVAFAVALTGAVPAVTVAAPQQNVTVPAFTGPQDTVVSSTPQTVFPFTFPFWDAADIIVSVDDTVLAPSAYTVQGLFVQNGSPVIGGYGSGTVTLNTAVSNVTVTIDRLVNADRQSQFSRTAPLPMTALNADLNRLTARDQDLQRRLSGGGGGGGGSTTFATWTELQAGAVTGEAIDPATAILGVPTVYRDIISDVRPSNPILNDSGGILAAWNGEQTYNAIRIRSRLRQPGILGTPTTGYLYTAETVPVRVWLLNRSGYNHATDSNVGRTGAAAIRVNVAGDSTVQGDTHAFNASGFIAGARSGATNFLANPAVTLFTGDATAGANGTYLNVREIAMNDGGYDVAAIGDVLNLNRTVATGALSATWIGYRPQSVGSQPIDAFYSAVGSARIGLDLSTGSYTQAAITLAGDQTINFNATNSSTNKFPDETAVGSTYLKFNPSTSRYEFWVGGTLGAQIGSTGVVGAGARGVTTLTANDTEWDITTSNVLYVTANSTATTVTGIAAGLPNGTEFTVHFNDANTTLDSNISGGFSLNGFLDVNPPTGAVMTFVKTASNILETGRSFGGLVPGFFTFPDGFTTPEVQSGRPHYKLSNTSATTITNFLNGNGSQQIVLLATNDNTTIQHNGTTISLVGGANTVIPSGHTMTLIRDGSLWREINRTFPNTGWGSLNTGTTPSIVGLGENVVMVHGSSTSITNFVGGSNGRLLRLHFTNSNVTLVNGSSLNLRGGSNVTPGNNNIITLIRDYVGNWVEVSRNF
ncbi:MAG: hypothetical protein IOB84_13625 [Brevundimonas sp.]|nr:hypothetical protein [Brevundimonas sp.]